MATSSITPPVHGHRVGQGRPEPATENNIVQAGQVTPVRTALPGRAFSGTVPPGKAAIIRGGIIVGVK